MWSADSATVYPWPTWQSLMVAPSEIVQPLQMMLFRMSQPSAMVMLSISTLLATLTLFPTRQPAPMTERFTLHLSPSTVPSPTVHEGPTVVRVPSLADGGTKLSYLDSFRAVSCSKREGSDTSRLTSPNAWMLSTRSQYSLALVSTTPHQPGHWLPAVPAEWLKRCQLSMSLSTAPASVGESARGACCAAAASSVLSPLWERLPRSQNCFCTSNGTTSPAREVSSGLSARSCSTSSRLNTYTCSSTRSVRNVIGPDRFSGASSTGSFCSCLSPAAAWHSSWLCAASSPMYVTPLGARPGLVSAEGEARVRPSSTVSTDALTRCAMIMVLSCTLVTTSPAITRTSRDVRRGATARNAPAEPASGSASTSSHSRPLGG
mmetsp:Transcript_3163/g.7858  ORF Transcript_3163/g.7858 Transcript_3163/m.7858 type:complete len:376 (-) Transcript_3163:332-1459(-)